MGLDYLDLMLIHWPMGNDGEIWSAFEDIDTLVQQLHSESMPEAVEGDMFVDSGSINQKRDFVIEDVRRKGREDCSLLPDWPQNGNCLLGKWYADFVPSFLDSDTHIITPLLSFQILPPKSQQICAPKPTSDIEANSLFDRGGHDESGRRGSLCSGISIAWLVEFIP